MNNKLILILSVVFLISFISATNYNVIAGEPYVFDLNETYEYYSIAGNYTIVDLTITQEGTIVTILTNKYSPTNSFEIIFLNKEKEVIVEVPVYRSGGGGTRTIVKEVIKEVPNYITQIEKEDCSDTVCPIIIDDTTQKDLKKERIYTFFIVLVGIGLIFGISKWVQWYNKKYSLENKNTDERRLKE